MKKVNILKRHVRPYVARMIPLSLTHPKKDNKICTSSTQKDTKSPVTPVASDSPMADARSSSHQQPPANPLSPKDGVPQNLPPSTTSAQTAEPSCVKNLAKVAIILAALTAIGIITALFWL